MPSDIPVKSIRIGLVMKLRYSLRQFLIGTIVLGAISAFVMKHWTQAAPIQLRSTMMGKLSDDPGEPIEEPTLDEIMHAMDGERQSFGSEVSGRITGRIMERTILGATTSIEPPRFVPLIGNASLHRVMFRCSVKWRNRDGSVSSDVVLIEKNAFRLIQAEP